MVKFKKVWLLMFTLVLVSLIFTSNAVAKDVIFNGSIEEGDGYQINNVVIDIAEVFVSANSCIFKVYDENDEIEDKMLSDGNSLKFTAEGETIELTLLSVSGGTLPRATISVTTTDDDNIFLKKVVDGGHEKAQYSGTPSLEIVKEISSYSVDQGDMITVRVSVSNKGDGRATEVRFSDPKPTGFILQEILLEESGQLTIDKYESRTIFLYKLQANEAGTFEFQPTRATYSNDADLDYPEALSNKPVVTVADTGKNAKKSADLEFTTSIGSNSVKRGDDVEVTMHIKNKGDSYANGVVLKLQIPEGLEYKDSNSNIEIINDVPKAYLETFGLNQEKEIKYIVKAKELGTYSITTDYSYQYEDGLSNDQQDVRGEFTTNTIDVARGDLDSVLEKPWYVIATPILIIIAIGGWLFHRSKQYRF